VPTIDWDISLWSQKGATAKPDQLLYESTIAADKVQQKLIGTVTRDFGGSLVTVPVYDFKADLPGWFVTKSDTTYWLEIFSNQSLGHPWWAWYTGTSSVRNGLVRQSDLNGNNAGNSVDDTAFTLYGTIVPEPASLGMLTLASGVVCLRRRRRVRSDHHLQRQVL